MTLRMRPYIDEPALRHKPQLWAGEVKNRWPKRVGRRPWPFSDASMIREMPRPASTASLAAASTKALDALLHPFGRPLLALPLGPTLFEGLASG
jgi:hypothetical protein